MDCFEFQTLVLVLVPEGKKHLNAAEGRPLELRRRGGQALGEDRAVTPLQSGQISVRAPAGPGQAGAVLQRRLQHRPATS